LKCEIGLGVSVRSRVARLHGTRGRLVSRAVHVIATVAADFVARFACLAAIAFAASLLYIPFLHNGLIFDDHNLFTNLAVYDYATTPFSSGPRTFPYFMRVDFARVLHSKAIIFDVAGFLAMPVIGLVCLSQGRSKALFGCGLLLSWSLFLPELSSVRLQEPFVLYRSYLWAPGFAIMLVTLLHRLDWKLVLVGVLVLMPVEIFLSRDRLQSLSSERAVWEDAAAKLASPAIPGADRIYFNRGTERGKRGDLDAALDDFNKVVALTPASFHGYFGRGVIYLQGGQFASALDEFNQVLRMKPEFVPAMYRKGLALENMGLKEAALAAYRDAANRGDTMAGFRVAYLLGRNSPPASRAPPPHP
jgi:hypothetical protein